MKETSEDEYIELVRLLADLLNESIFVMEFPHTEASFIQRRKAALKLAASCQSLPPRPQALQRLEEKAALGEPKYPCDEDGFERFPV